MQPGDAQRLARQVDASDMRRTARHRLGEDAAAAAHVQHLPAVQRRQRFDPLEPQRVDCVQRPELAARIPPSVGHFTEFRQFARVDVAHRQQS